MGIYRLGQQHCAGVFIPYLGVKEVTSRPEVVIADDACLHFDRDIMEDRHVG